ncbi:conserved hypothetical protein [Ricinus communis]|uniref:Uncharacterized protein n=1 Tax=Ricinus communis TaxID=3988 RepID=B9STE9_RICCO|nr:conserved hypothetical protein [Ricinus communis]
MKQDQAVLPPEEISFVNKVRERLEGSDEYGYPHFFHGWNLCKEGHMSKHDLFCELVDVFSCDHRDFLDELKKLLIYSTACPSAE